MLREGMSPDVPLLERLKFLAIVSSNPRRILHDSGGRAEARRGRQSSRSPISSGMTPEQQTGRNPRPGPRQMIAEQARAIREVMQALAPQGICLLGADDATTEQRRFLRSYFATGILPALTPFGRRGT